MKDKKDKSCFKFRWLIPFAVLGFVALFTYAVYALWNGVLVDVVAVKAISYWQALGILVLAKILFGGFPGRRGKFGPGWRGRMMAKRWQSLDPEQRARMREEMRRRFGDWPRPPWEEEGGNAPAAPGKPSGP